MGIKSTTKEFIEKAKLIHGDKYDYSKVDYKDKKTKVLIGCPAHGEFNQAPSVHLQKKGCAICGKERMGKNATLTQESFIEKVTDIWKDRYDFSKVNYKTSNIKIEVICKNHGIFNITPFNLLLGHGCKKCYIDKKTISKEDTINTLKTVHGDLYIYNLDNYVTLQSKIVATCKIHGDWTTTCEILKRGCGCYTCGLTKNKVGWENHRWEAGGKESKFFDSYKVYLIHCFNSNENFYKIGKTYTTATKRFLKPSDMPYQWILVQQIEGDAKTISELEKSLHSQCKEYKYQPEIPFKGQQECFQHTDEVKQIFLQHCQ
jgi:hypothetical protein